MKPVTNCKSMGEKQMKPIWKYFRMIPLIVANKLLLSRGMKAIGSSF